MVEKTALTVKELEEKKIDMAPELKIGKNEKV